MRYVLDIAIHDRNADRHDTLRSLDIERLLDSVGSDIPDLPSATMAQGIPPWERASNRNRARQQVAQKRA